MNLKRIKILSAGKLIAELKSGEYIDSKTTAAVICTDEMPKDPVLSRISYLCVQFEDVETLKEENAFTRMQASEISRFLMQLPDSITTLYCCCDFGQSRSAGLAAAVKRYLKQDYFALFNSSVYYPNLLVYAYMCEAMGCGQPTAEELHELQERRMAARDLLFSNKEEEGERISIKRIIAIGDSNTYGYDPSFPCGGRYAESLWWTTILGKTLSIPVLNRGVNGKAIPCTVAELIAEETVLDEVKPGDLVMIMLGANNLLRAAPGTKEDIPIHNLTPEETASKMEKYLLWVKRECQDIDLLLIAPPKIHTDNVALQIKFMELSERYEELAQKRDVLYLNAWEWEELPYSCDGVHFSAEAHRIFAEKLADYIKSVMD